MTDPMRRNAAGLVAVILALAIGTALNIITMAILYAAYIRVGYDVNAGISDKGVQILLAWGGGIISVLAGYVGFIVGKQHSEERNTHGSQKSSSQESIRQGS